MTSLIPPRYVNVSAWAVYSDDLPDPLFRTYTRLVGLTWRDEKRVQVPVLSLDDLAVLCHRKPRAMRLHLKQLSRRQLITCRGDQSGFRIRMVDRALQGSATLPNIRRPALVFPEDGDDADRSLETSLRSSAADDPAFRANLTALSEFQVNVGVADAQEVAAMPHVNPELIRTWGQELEARPNTHNLPGLLLYILSTTHHEPRVETRGGPRLRKREVRPDRQMQDRTRLQPAHPLPHPVPEPDEVHNNEQLLADERVRLLLHLAQEEGEPLDLRLVHDLVQPYTVEQMTQLIAYSRTARGLTRSRLGYAISRLRSGELPVVASPDPEPGNEMYGIEASCPFCGAGYRPGESCRDCGRCVGCGSCEPVEEDPALVAARQLWQIALRELRLQMTREIFSTWLKGTQAIGRENDRLYVEVENDRVKDWLSNRLLGTITRTVNGIAGEEVEIQFVVKNDAKSSHTVEH